MHRILLGNTVVTHHNRSFVQGADKRITKTKIMIDINLSTLLRLLTVRKRTAIIASL